MRDDHGFVFAMFVIALTFGVLLIAVNLCSRWIRRRREREWEYQERIYYVA